MEFNKKTGVNYDYVLALKNEGQRVCVVKIPIKRHDTEIEQALKFLYDDNTDVTDVYWPISECLNGMPYNLCLNHDYTDYDIKPIYSPELDVYAYKSNLQNCITWLILYKGVDIRFLDSQSKFIVQQEAWRALYPKILKRKMKFMSDALPYIYAADYYKTIQNNHIKEEYIAYSNEAHGFYRPSHKINDDISIMIDTNFCYGNSSYFHVIVTYKGIELLPYSVWVRYYFARITELTGCTRSYLAERNSWHECMSFLESFINSALSDSESFIHNEIMTEVNGLMIGLEDIFKEGDAQFKKELNVKQRPGDERYIGIAGVRNANDKEKETYKIAPHEISMIYKMEKISGALKFLTNLRKLTEIYDEISGVIHRIIEMNKIILPDIENAIPPIEEEIRELTCILIPLKKELASSETGLNQLEKRLSQWLQGAKSSKDKTIITDLFKQKHPRYNELKTTVDKLYTDIHVLKTKIRERERVKERLQSYKRLILEHTN